VEGVLAGLEALPLAAALRGSTYAYPLVNAAHIAGVALLFGAIAAYDLRLLGALGGAGTRPLARTLLPLAVFGLALAVIAGALLFLTDARDYAASRLFQAKMLAIALAVANALLLRLVTGRRRGEGEAVGRRERTAAAASLLLWLCALILGRLVGYF